MLPGLAPEEARDLTLSVGTHHGKRRLSPVEVGLLFRKAIAAGASPTQCAHFVHLTGPSMVSRFLRLLRLSPEIQHTVDWRQAGATIAFAAAWRLADLGVGEQTEAASQIMSLGLSTSEVSQILQIKKRSHRPLSECIAEVVGMRPSITRRHLFLGSVTDEAARTYLSGLKQGERDRLLESMISEIYGPLAKTSARLGADRFTITTDEEGASKLKNFPSSFEVAINSRLSKLPKA